MKWTTFPEHLCPAVMATAPVVTALFLLLPLTSAFILDSKNSCVGRCNQHYDKSQACSCNSQCSHYGDCCHDYQTVCHSGSGVHVAPTTSPNTSDSCAGRCHGHYDQSQACQCNSACPHYNNCCPDYQDLCSGAPATTHSSHSASCAGHCGASYVKTQTCQCNSACSSHHDCCPDYQHVCGGVSATSHPSNHGSSSSNPDLSSMADTLWQKDVNRFSPTDLVYDAQGQVSGHSHTDHAPKPLFTHVNEALFSRPTYAAFIALFDNYNPNSGVAESLSGQKGTEVDTFLSAVMATDVMKTTLKFLQDHGTFTGDETAFETELKQIWFQPYSRSGHGTHDSSGFEHDFLGEYKSSTVVNGFHNWVRLYKEEKAGHVNYLGYIKELKPNMLSFSMTWMNHEKPISSVFLGTSPEFDLALATLCFLSSNGHQCHFSLAGTSFSVQTYDLASSPGLQVATAYPEF